MSTFAVNVPINSVSFGQTSTALLREMKGRSLDPSIFPIGGQVDLSTQTPDKDFDEWVQKNCQKAAACHSRNLPSFKLWHLNGSLESFSDKQILLSFYELDEPTAAETNIARNNTTLFTSQYTVDAFRNNGAETHYVPLFFDKFNFRNTNKQYFDDGRITFNIVGKVEKRKRHEKTIRAWIKRFGGDKKYFLQCAIYNPFFKDADNNAIINNICEGKKIFNVGFLGFMGKNAIYNDFLNSGDIILGLSGGEGWGLPEFHSVGLGKHAVIMDAHSYKGWANEKNSTLVNPSGKIEAYDGMFFHKGHPFNQGNIFDYNEDEFIAACEEAIKKVEENRVNEEGLKIQEEFTVDKTLDRILEFV
jgi:hypothetical protein